MANYHGWDQASIEKDKRALRRAKGIRRPHSVDKALPSYDAAARAEKADKLSVLPLKVGFKPRGFGKRARSGCRMSEAFRDAMMQREAKRQEFFDGLRG